MASDTESVTRLIRAGYRIPHEVAFEWATRIAKARELPAPSSLDDDGRIWMHIEDALMDYDFDIMAVSDSNAPPHEHSWILGTSPRQRVDFSPQELEGMKFAWDSPVQLPEQEADRELQRQLERNGVKLGEFRTVLWPMDM
ncbi:hypothetical protein BD626DRAFT_503599 [Schizophyllum amplum]|uniref:Uncharacterized protein n=1 Tax=Schizophyllum amplum TaxID=97359 RepID=A0A550C7D2_9AGAR|nr:hypothetical protein BD626DRAFT_503599 [Auriculariopsis ampla]